MHKFRQPGRSARLLLAVIIGLGLAVTIDIARTGGPTAWLALRGLGPPYHAMGERVASGERSVYLDCRGSGLPTVVLEAGMGGGAGSWGSVFEALASTTRTCAYDRAGLGSSDARGRHTLLDAVVDLRTVLMAAGESGPFIVVGHSLGGSYARVFGDRFGNEVAGIVLVDSFDPDLETARIHPLLGDLRPEYEARLDRLRALVADVESLDWPSSEQELRGSSLAGLPIEVLRAPRAEPRLDAATNAAIAAASEDGYASLSPGNVRYELTWGAGHMIQFDRPDLVIVAVGRLIDGWATDG